MSFGMSNLYAGFRTFHSLKAYRRLKTCNRPLAGETTLRKRDDETISGAGIIGTAKGCERARRGCRALANGELPAARYYPIAASFGASNEAKLQHTKAIFEILN